MKLLANQEINIFQKIINFQSLKPNIYLKTHSYKYAKL